MSDLIGRSWECLKGAGKYMRAVAGGDIRPHADARRIVDDHCARCPSAQRRAVPLLGYYWTCGAPGEAVEGESCGCVIAVETDDSQRQRRGKPLPRVDPAQAAATLTIRGRPYAKALVASEQCPRALW